MPGFVYLLRCVGRAALKNSVRALASLVPFGEAAYEIARDVCEEYQKGPTADLRTDLDGLLRASPAAVRQAAEEVAAEVAADQPPDVQLALVSYLDQMRLTGLSSALPSAAEQTPEQDSPILVPGAKHTYTLLRLLAVGDVSDVHLAGAGSDRVPGGKARYTLKVSRIPEGQALLDRERRVLSHLLTRAGDTTYSRYLPTLVESFPIEDRFPKRVNVFLHEEGFYTAEEVNDRHPLLDGRHLAWIFKRLLTVLGFCHGRGIVHGAVLPCHVLIHAANHGLQLVGWGQCEEIGQRINSLCTRYRDWYPPEVLNKQPATQATDLFLAARCMVQLAGGDPVTHRMPDTVPDPMKRFFTACLLPGVRMRPDNAWQLLDEFDEMLHHLYGPPRFYPLVMI